MDRMPKLLKKEKLDEDLSLGARLDMNEFTSAMPEDSERKVISQSELSYRGLRDEILGQARVEAGVIKEHAKKLYLQVEDKVREASEQGFVDGREAGLASVTEMLTKIAKQNEDAMASLEKGTLKIVFEIASRLIGDAFKVSDEALLGMIRQALSASLGNELTVLLNPADFERVKASQSTLIAALHGSQVLKLRPAEPVKLNSCVVESELGTIEADLELQLKAIKKALGLEDEA